MSVACHRQIAPILRSCHRDVQKSTTFLVIQAQRDLATAQGVEVNALANYSRARTQMDVAAGTLLQTNSISLDEALTGTVAHGPSPLP